MSERAREKRRATIAHVEQSQEYLEATAFVKEAHPDSDQAMSKRTWEKAMSEWRAALRNDKTRAETEQIAIEPGGATPSRGRGFSVR